MASEKEELLPETQNIAEETNHGHSEIESAGPSSNDVPLLAWNSVINLVADAEPIHAAGVAGLLVILLVSIFGRIGSLAVGVLAGLLLHASLERRRDNVRLQDLTDKFRIPDSIIQREVLASIYFEEI